MTKKIKLLLIAMLLLLIVGISALLSGKNKHASISITTVAPSIATITNSVTATGTVEPIEKVEVGTQVSGVINQIYVDFNSYVKKGQVLAELDRSTLNARLLQSRAGLSSAKNELDWQTQNYNRTKSLYEKEMVSDVDYELAVYQLNNAKSQVERLTSEVEQAEVDLSYATIYSPIDGVVLERAIEAGQTVAASFNTPTLFTIARDLTQMQVEADVDEADIGQIEHGQKVHFKVDAYPGRIFEGVITQIRLIPTITSNVVTYKVIIDAPNPDLKLKPGLTATITIITAEASNILVIPTSATNINHHQIITLSHQNNYIIDNQPPGKNLKDLADNEKKVWIVAGNSISERIIQTGITDRVHIEVKDGLEKNDAIILSIDAESGIKEKENLNSPFVPTPPGGRR